MQCGDIGHIFICHILVSLVYLVCLVYLVESLSLVIWSLSLNQCEKHEKGEKFSHWVNK